MKQVLIASKNTSLPNYLFLLIDQLYPQHFKLANDYSDAVDLLIIDVETLSTADLAAFETEKPVILFAFGLKPLLIQFTTRFDINGVITLSMEASEIRKTLETAVSGDIFYNEAMISMLFSNSVNETANRISSLTDRETEIIDLMMKDQTNEEIAVSLDLSVRTVNAHKGNIMRKIGSKTTSGLIQTLLEYMPNFRKEP